VTRDLPLIGDNDLDIASCTIPPLTTIWQIGVRMGRTAVDLQRHHKEEEARR
jgi:DNA-binding LacI/PurR family transcriptional regulator